MRVHCDIAHTSTYQLKGHLFRMSTVIGTMHRLNQNDCRIANGAKVDKRRCIVAKALLEEAFSIMGGNSHYHVVAKICMLLACTQ